MILYAAVFVGYLGILSGSIFFGWSSPALPLYQEEDASVRPSDDESGWIASLFLVGCAVGPFVCLTIAHIVGRRIILIIAAIPWIIGWLIIAFATSAWELCISRFLAGMGTGVTFAVTPMYIGEIAPAKIRGILLTIIMMSSRFGIMLAYTLIPFVSLKTSSLIFALLTIIIASNFLWLPESPYYLIRRDNHDDAAKSLARIRGKNFDEINDELILIETSVKNEHANSHRGFRDIIMSPGNRKSLTIGVMLGLIQQLSGSQAIMLYTQQIFDDMNIELDGKYLAMILGIVQILSTGLCAVIVDHYGRRPLLLLSAIGSFIATGVIAIYFNLRWIGNDTSNITWLPALGCMLYVVFYSLGLAPLPTTMIGELFPTNIKPVSCAIVVFWANLSGFLVGKTYQLISNSVGTHVAFWTFTTLNVLAIIYIYFCVPETKGKTLQEIQREMHHNDK